MKICKTSYLMLLVKFISKQAQHAFYIYLLVVGDLHCCWLGARNRNEATFCSGFKKMVFWSRSDFEPAPKKEPPFHNWYRDWLHSHGWIILCKIYQRCASFGWECVSKRLYFNLNSSQCHRGQNKIHLFRSLS